MWQAEKEIVENSTWGGAHFNGLLFGRLATQQTSLLDKCYNSAWCDSEAQILSVSIYECFFPAVLLIIAVSAS